MSPTPVLTITMLGGFSVASGERVIAERAWGSRKALQLVKLLALAPQQRLSSEQVLDVLWPEQDPGTLNAALRQTCYLARRALALPEALLVRGGVIALAPPDRCAIDWIAFERAASVARRTRSRDDYVAALARYGGPLLPDDRYADWALALAERLHGLTLTLRRELAALHEEAGEESAAEPVWQRILADEAADEEAHVGLMRLYARQGRRQLAMRQYQLLHTRLRDDLDVAPNSQTQNLYAAILGGHFPPAAPPPKAPAAPPRALPPQAFPTPLTRLIGRTAEIAAAVALVGGDARLVTLTGAGGCGKTRLALGVAEVLHPDFPDGVWWVSLAALFDGALVAGAVAEVVGARPTPQQTPLAALTALLGQRTALIVLDNAEHLRASCAELALALLSACAGLRIVVTSRAALRVVGEQTWRVPSLPIPGAVNGEASEAEHAALATNDAVALFVARARLVRADFALTAGNAAAVASICRTLEGLPLAIELAAARVGLLEPGQLAARLGDALGVLGGGAHGLPPRQLTLRATLDWSYDLLAAPEQILLGRLSVFAGGWTLDAAETIGADAGLDVLLGLAELVEHSLVQVEPDARGDEPRYRLLEPTRQYAAARLAATATEAATREAHARYFLALAERVDPKNVWTSDPATAHRLRPELGNLRAAWAWWIERREHEACTRLVGALRLFWRQQEYIHEGWSWSEALSAVAEAAIASAAIAKAALTHAEIALTLGHWSAGAAQGERAVRLFAASGEPRGQAYALNVTAMNLRSLGELDAAQPYLARAAALFGTVGDRRGALICQFNLAAIAFDRGEVAAARERQLTLLPELRALNDIGLFLPALFNLATYTLSLRQGAGVAALLAESFSLSMTLDDRRLGAWVLMEWADLATLDEQWVLAARLLGTGEAMLRRHQLPITPAMQPFHDRVAATASAALGEVAYQAALAAGEALSPDAAIAEALGATADLTPA